jgi:YegS/Rv2252/BmrU family lipid kinase
MKILLVCNPNAGHGRAAALAAEAAGLFKEKGISVDLRLTEGPGHAVQIVRGADLAGYGGVAAAGGDGTLFEVVNGYYANPAHGSIPLGILPTGTGNAFARDLNMDAGRWREAVEIIAAGKRRRVDVGRYITGGKTFYFLNILGLGFVADVVVTAARLKMFGNLSYIIGVVVRTLFLHSYPIRIEADGRVIEQENLFAEISNARGYTSNFLMAPQARIDDGLLDVTLLGRMGRLRLLKSIPLFFTGEHLTLPEVETFRAGRLRISTPAPKVLTPDGELAGSTPVEVECLKQDIEVFWR